MIDNFGTGIFATVMDSYDYAAALQEVLPGEQQGHAAKAGRARPEPGSTSREEGQEGAHAEAQRGTACNGGMHLCTHTHTHLC